MPKLPFMGWVTLPFLCAMLAACGGSSSGSAASSGSATSGGSGSASVTSASSSSSSHSASSSSTASASSSSSSSSGGTTTTTTAQVVADASDKLAAITANQVGTNLAIWYDVTASALPGEVASVSPTIIRWPGGSTSDEYHWQDHTECSPSYSGATSYTSGPAYDPNSTFDNFMKSIVIPGKYAAAITVDYGTNVSCDAGGEPSEAAAWVADAKSKGYNSYIHYWTVGNEVFGGWEVDLHSPANDPTTYAAAVSGSSGYYQLMKAADSTAQVGVVVVGGSGYNNWDQIVLAKAQYDFVELHWYAQQPGSESDSWLLNSGPSTLTSTIATLRQELTAAGKGSTPIMLGEVNSVAYNPGKQTMSIVNALFTGMVVGEVLNDNVAITTWWFGAGGTQGCNDNNSSSLYGWQSFGGYDLVAANSVYSWNYCTSNTGPEIVPEGTVFPSGNAFALAEKFAAAGNSVLGVTVTPSGSNVHAYAATAGSGYAFMLFNLSETDTTTATVSVSNAAATSFTGTTLTYGKTQYDNSQNNVWTGPVSASLGTVTSGSVSVKLPPWSMTLLQLQ